MKKFILPFVAALLVCVSMYAQPQRASFVKAKTQSLANFEIQNIFAKFDKTKRVGVIDLKKLKQGRNHLLTDRRNGRKLMLLAERRGSKVRVAGFMIQEKNGRYFRLPDSSSQKGKPGGGFGCPDNWNADLICYTHPTYQVKVCYVRCTPTQLTLKFPAGL